MGGAATLGTALHRVPVGLIPPGPRGATTDLDNRFLLLSAAVAAWRGVWAERYSWYGDEKGHGLQCGAM